jgi:general secretion pathway protein N
MTIKRTWILTAAAASILAALGAGFARAADDPTGLGLNEDEPARSGRILPSKAPAEPLVQEPKSTNVPERGNPLWGIPIESLKATRERPLFSPARRPPAPVVIATPVEVPKVVAPPPPPEVPAFDLVGVVEGDGQSYAVFINTNTHDTVRLRTGEGQDGWILRSVNGRKVVLEKNNRTAVIELPALIGGQK